MSEYKITLHSRNHSNISLNLYPVKDIIKVEYSDLKISEHYVYNDDSYYFSITNFDNTLINVDNVFINDEAVDNWNKSEFYFKECFGLVKFTVLINGEHFNADYLSVMMNPQSVNKNLFNMIDYIYDNCEDFLYEDHKKSNAFNGIKKDINISIDSKLSLLEEIYDTYVRCYHHLKYSPQTELVTVDKVASFGELTTLHPNTLRYIVEHPEELEEVNYNSGIIGNKQYYQPKSTLVRSVDYSYDIYENHVILGFLITIIKELNEMKKTIFNIKKQIQRPKEKDGYFESIYYIYRKNENVLNIYISNIDSIIPKFQKLYGNYFSIFGLDSVAITTMPKFSNIFRSVLPYRQIFERILEWFNCGNYDLKKSTLLMSFLSSSKIYEYYCLIKINKAIIELGYALKESKAHKYLESKYYTNTIYSNTFSFEKDEKSVVVYFQPVIYNDDVEKNVKNDIFLYRNTSISLTPRNLYSEREMSGSYYTPDYILKVSKGENTNYYILDAKFTTIKKVEIYQLPELVYKYIFSISPWYDTDSMAGVCFMCGKDSEEIIKNLHNNSQKLGKKVFPSAHIISLIGENVRDNSTIRTLLSKYIE